MGKLNLFMKAKKLYDDYGVYGITAGICLSVIGTAIFSYKAGKKAAENPDMTTKEKVLNLVPTVVTSAAAIGGTIALNSKHLSKEAGLVSMIMFDEKKQEAFKKTVKQVVGEETYNEIRGAMHPATPTNADIAALKEGELLWLDDYTGIKFRATPAQVIEAEYRTNMLVQRRGYASVTDWLDSLNIGFDRKENRKEAIEFEEAGWSANAENHPEYGYKWVDFEHRDMKAKDGTPYILIDCVTEPHFDYLSI